MRPARPLLNPVTHDWNIPRFSAFIRGLFTRTRSPGIDIMAFGFVFVPVDSIRRVAACLVVNQSLVHLIDSSLAGMLIDSISCRDGKRISWLRMGISFRIFRLFRSQKKKEKERALESVFKVVSRGNIVRRIISPSIITMGFQHGKQNRIIYLFIYSCDYNTT